VRFHTYRLPEFCQYMSSESKGSSLWILRFVALWRRNSMICTWPESGCLERRPVLATF
jgi:hypothetical protein